MKHSSPISRRFLCHRAGSVMVEFGLLLPILLFLFFGAIEVSRYILLLQKVDKVAYTMADIITRTRPATGTPPVPGSLTAAEMTTILNTYTDLMSPYSVNDRGIVTVTSIHKPNSAQPPIIKWQVTGGGGLGADPSVLPEPDSLKSEINGLAPSEISPAVRNSPVAFSPEVEAIMSSSGGMRTDENMIIVEVFYLYSPLIYGNTLGFGDVVFHRKAFFTPRYENLLTLPPAF